MPRKLRACKRCQAAKTKSAAGVCRRCRYGGRGRMPTVEMVLDLYAQLPPTPPRLLTRRATAYPLGRRKGVW